MRAGQCGENGSKNQRRERNGGNLDQGTRIRPPPDKGQPKTFIAWRCEKCFCGSGEEEGGKKSRFKGMGDLGSRAKPELLSPDQQHQSTRKTAGLLPNTE